MERSRYWLVFYQCWTVGIASVFGVFVALLSKGRKLWEVVTYSFLMPVCVSLLWVCVWGGTGMRQDRQAVELEKLGLDYFNNSAHFLADGSDLCYTVPQGDIEVSDATIFTNRLLGVTPVCKFDQERAYAAIWNVLKSFGSGHAIIAIYMVGTILFYITMSDAASFMVDNFASNGRKNNHWARRLLWACTAGVLATTLLSLRGMSAVDAVDSGLTIAALPMAILMCFLLQTITLFCDAAINDSYGADYNFPDQPEFGMPVYGGILNILEFLFSFGKVNPARAELGMHLPTEFQCIEFFKGLFIPFVSLSQVLNSSYPENPKTNMAVIACYTVGHLCWIFVFLASLSQRHLSGLATTIYFMTGGVLGLIRMDFRTRYNLRSNYFADWMTSTFLWPQVLAQMRQHCVGTHEKEGEVGKRIHSDEGDRESSEDRLVTVDDADTNDVHA
jgi:Cys-rich protein (TIGR01571 family)